MATPKKGKPPILTIGSSDPSYLKAIGVKDIKAPTLTLGGTAAIPSGVASSILGATGVKIGGGAKENAPGPLFGGQRILESFASATTSALKYVGQATIGTSQAIHKTVSGGSVDPTTVAKGYGTVILGLGVTVLAAIAINAMVKSLRNRWKGSSEPAIGGAEGQWITTAAGRKIFITTKGGSKTPI